MKKVKKKIIKAVTKSIPKKIVSVDFDLDAFLKKAKGICSRAQVYTFKNGTIPSTKTLMKVSCETNTPISKFLVATKG